MDEFSKHILSTHSVPSTVLGTGDAEMEGTCSQLQRNSQSSRAKCHITKSAHGKYHNKGRQPWALHREGLYRLAHQRLPRAPWSLRLACSLPHLSGIPAAPWHLQSSLQFFPSRGPLQAAPLPLLRQALLGAQPRPPEWLSSTSARRHTNTR